MSIYSLRTTAQRDHENLVHRNLVSDQSQRPAFACGAMVEFADSYVNTDGIEGVTCPECRASWQAVVSFMDALRAQGTFMLTAFDLNSLLDMELFSSDGYKSHSEYYESRKRLIERFLSDKKRL